MNCFLNWPKIIQEKKNHLIQVSELCGARKYIHGQDYVDPPPPGITFSMGGGL